jgi:hypothetical protein
MLARSPVRDQGSVGADACTREGERPVWRIVATRLAAAIPILFLVLLLSFLLSPAP